MSVEFESLRDSDLEDFKNCCSNGDLEAVKEMVLAKPRKTEFLDIGFNFVAPKGHVEVAKYLLENGALAHTFLVLEAIRGNSLEMVKLLVDSGWNLREEGHHVVSRSVEHEHILRYLVESGAPVDRGPPRWNPHYSPEDEYFDKNAGDALNVAAARGSPKVFDYLIDQGAPLSAATPLHHAALAGRIDMLEHLIQPRFGLDINALDWQEGIWYARGTPLANVTFNRSGLNTVPWLREHGAINVFIWGGKVVPSRKSMLA